MIIDGHQDIAMALLREPGRDFGAPPGAGQALSLPGLQGAGFGLVVATIFAPSGYWKDQTPQAAARKQLHLYEELLYRFEDRLFRVESQGDLPLCRAGGPIGMVHLMEGADPFESPDDLGFWVDQGVRFIGLAWNHGNRYAGGTKDERGVTPEGRQLLEAMEEEGVVPDLSHLNPRAIDDVLRNTEGPVIASHSNAAKIRPHARNLSDAHLRAVAEREGVVGIVLYGPFLSEEAPTLDHVVRHIEHVAEVAGVEHVGLGTDLDGGFTTDLAPDGIGTVADIPRIGHALERHGWSAPDIAAVMGGNWHRVIQEALPE